MLRHTTVPLARAWNTWSMRPAEMVFLPLGVRISPVLYSSRTRTTSAIAPREDVVRLGRHAIDGGVVEVSTDHAGTRLDLRLHKIDPFTIRGTWEGVDLGEWGLRFWVTLAVSCEGGETVSYDVQRGCAIVKVGTRYLAVATGAAPLQVTGHADVAGLRADFETNGYFHTGSRSDAAALLGLRFNLEITRRGVYAAAVADTAALAIARATAALAAPATAPPPMDLQTGVSSGALDAVRDVVAWNTIWDAANARPYTTVSRIWNLGDFAVWYNDQTYAALMAGLFDTTLARENMAVAHAGATPEGNIACIVTSQDAWVDRSQPPLGSFIAWMLYLRTGERSFLDDHYETLARNNRWWRSARDPEGSGLVSCGSSAVGEALYADTAFGARNETGMDNSATHDEAVYDPATRTLSTVDLGLNCALCLDSEMLAAIAGALGRHAEAEAFAQVAQRSRALIATTLWDERRGLFANRQRKGGFVRSVGPTSFYPLVCGAASEAQARRLLDHLADPATFGGPFVLPNATRDDPAFADNVYWRGRIWPNVNFLVWQGLRRYGFLAEAGDLAAKGHAMFMAAWRERRIAAENYSATTGEPMDQPDTDPFYIWGALLPLMAVGEIMDVDPWGGWTLANGGADVRLGPLASPIGPVDVAVAGGTLTLARAGAVILATDIAGRLTHLRIARDAIAFTIERARPGGGLRLPSTAPASVLAVRVDGGDAPFSACEDGIALDPGGASRVDVTVFLRA
jgi:putative isomerase